MLGGEKKRDGRVMLQALLKNEDSLTELESDKFKGMDFGLASGRKKKLTQAQHDWVERVYLRLNLDAEEAENLVSSGAISSISNIALPWVLRPENLPKHPPGWKPSR